MQLQIYIMEVLYLEQMCMCCLSALAKEQIGKYYEAEKLWPRKINISPPNDLLSKRNGEHLL